MRDQTVRVLLPLLFTAGVAGYERTVDLRAIDEAAILGQSRDESVRARFHRPYRLQVARPPIYSVDVVTPFRRVELAVEERGRAGDRLFRQRDGLDALAAHGDTIELFVEATFHPQNTYIAVPGYRVTLAAPGATTRIEPRAERHVPRYGPRVLMGPIALPYPLTPSLPAGGEPLSGGTVIASFDGQRLDARGAYDVVIEESGKELARVRMDLAEMR